MYIKRTDIVQDLRNRDCGCDTIAHKRATIEQFSLKWRWETVAGFKEGGEDKASSSLSIYYQQQ